MFVLQFKARLAGEDAFRGGWYQLSLKKRNNSGSKVSVPPYVSLWPWFAWLQDSHLIIFAFRAQEHRCCISLFACCCNSRQTVSWCLQLPRCNLSPPSAVKKKKQPGEKQCRWFHCVTKWKILYKLISLQDFFIATIPLGLFLFVCLNIMRLFIPIIKSTEHSCIYATASFY